MEDNEKAMISTLAARLNDTVPVPHSEGKYYVPSIMTDGLEKSENSILL